jgi:hypothetical protein
MEYLFAVTDLATPRTTAWRRRPAAVAQGKDLRVRRKSDRKSCNKSGNGKPVTPTGTAWSTGRQNAGSDENAADDGGDEDESGGKQCDVKDRLHLLSQSGILGCGRPLVRRSFAQLVNMSMRDTPMCHVLPPVYFYWYAPRFLRSIYI